jgi:hypothetical protein
LLEKKEKGNCRRRKREPPKKTGSEVFRRSFNRLQQALKMFEKMDPNTNRLSLIEKNAVHGAVSATSQSMMETEKRINLPPWTYF